MRQGKRNLHNYLCDPSVMLWSVETALQIKNNTLHIATPDRTLELSTFALVHLHSKPSHKYEPQWGSNEAGEGQTRRALRKAQACSLTRVFPCQLHLTRDTCSRSQNALIHFQYLKHHQGRGSKALGEYSPGLSLWPVVWWTLWPSTLPFLSMLFPHFPVFHSACYKFYCSFRCPCNGCLKYIPEKG